MERADGGDFLFEGNTRPMSPMSLLPGTHCQMTVAFWPIGSGTRMAAVSISDSVPTSPQMVPLTGSAVGGKVKPR